MHENRVLKLALTTLEHDHAWWTIDHILAERKAALVALSDPHPHLLEKARGKGYPGVQLYSDTAEMLDREKPDALIVTAANSEHRVIVETCASRHVHCMVQKPMATRAGDAGIMEQAARGAGIRLMVNCFPFWSPEFQEISRRIADNELGPVQKYISHHGHQGHKGIGILTSDYLGWLYDPVRHGGGAFMDQGSYGVAYALHVLGRPDAIHAEMNNLKPHESTAVEDDAVALMGFKNATAVVQGSQCWPFRRTEVQIYGPRGGLRLANETLVFEEAYSPTDPAKRVTVPIQPSPVPPERKNGIASFVDCMLTGKEFDDIQSARFNVLVAEVVDAAYRSARERSVVMLK